MLKNDNSEAHTRSWKKIAIVVTAVVVVAAAIWMVRDKEPAVERPVVCAYCGYTGAAEAGDYIVPENWPSECPKCHKKQLYLSRVCPDCRKAIPLKDPKSDKFGYPKVCPYCTKPDRYDT
jgi:hypothetical protein